ncbi:MAG: hypothetical protein QF426_02140, partial [Verrucomicrobiales bacterium]|nr:hypothetical protein [Verrucomicrobiales bacterium]
MPPSQKKKVLMPNFGYKLTILILLGTILTLWLSGNIQIRPQSALNQKFSEKEPTPPSLNKSETKKNIEASKEDNTPQIVLGTTPTHPAPVQDKPSEIASLPSEPEAPKEPIITNDNFTISEQDQ